MVVRACRLLVTGGRPAFFLKLIHVHNFRHFIMFVCGRFRPPKASAGLVRLTPSPQEIVT